MNEKKNGLKNARDILIVITLVIWFIGLWSVLCMGAELWTTDFIWDGADCSIFLNFIVIAFCFIILGAWFIIPTLIMWLIYFIVWLIKREK